MPLAMETAFCDLVYALDQVKAAEPNDPARAPSRRPAVTMELFQVQPDTLQLGVTELTYRWSIRVYIDMTDWAQAQEDMKALIPELVTLITPLTDPNFRTLNGTCDEALLVDEGDAYDYRTDDGLIVKRLVLQAVVAS